MLFQNLAVGVDYGSSAVVEGDVLVAADGGDGGVAVTVGAGAAVAVAVDGGVGVGGGDDVDFVANSDVD